MVPATFSDIYGILSLYNARINVKSGRGGGKGAGIGWAFDNTGLPGEGQFDRCQARGRTVEFEPGNKMATPLQGDWKETSSSTRGSFKRRFLCHDG